MNVGANIAMQHGFVWKVCRSGYRLQGDKIVRVGNKMEAYLPSKMLPPPSYIFANLRSQILQHFETPPAPVVRRGRQIEFWQKKFPNGRAAALGFVSEFGFLTDCDAKSESLEALWQKSGQLGAYLAFRKSSINEDLSDFNRIVPPHFTLRMAAENGKAVPTVFPTSLLGWIWYRHGIDIADRVKWRECLYCYRPMAVGAAGGGRSIGRYRADTECCSASCLTMYSRRQEKFRRKPK